MERLLTILSTLFGAPLFAGALLAHTAPHRVGATDRDQTISQAERSSAGAIAWSAEAASPRSDVVAPCDRAGGGAAWACDRLPCCRSTREHIGCPGGPDRSCEPATADVPSYLTCEGECALPRVP